MPILNSLFNDHEQKLQKILKPWGLTQSSVCPVIPYSENFYDMLQKYEGSVAHNIF